MGTWRTFDTDEYRSPVVDAAIESGIDLFDSSPMYGRAEATLARALDGKRERLQVATKIWTASAEEGRSQADYALRLFDWVDVYQVHNLVNVPAQLALLERLKKEGKVRAVGATHYQESAFRDMAALMRTRRLDMVQIPYNPLRRTAERDLLPLAESLGLGVS
jgi:aryl-alcohol dehydrogenase-like predicted oxidoreductase